MACFSDHTSLPAQAESFSELLVAWLPVGRAPAAGSSLGSEEKWLPSSLPREGMLYLSPFSSSIVNVPKPNSWCFPAEAESFAPAGTWAFCS